VSSVGYELKYNTKNEAPSTTRCNRQPTTVRHGRVAGEKERAEEGDDRWGRDVREREREASARAWLGWATLLRHVDAGASEQAGHAAGPSRRKEGKAAPNESFCFSFSKM
jgi:hypothetical protein